MISECETFGEGKVNGCSRKVVTWGEEGQTHSNHANQPLSETTNHLLTLKPPPDTPEEKKKYTKI